jgi:lysozyme family protein
MAKSNFEACNKVTLQYEGGWCNHPRDPGGVTLEGVIQVRYNEYRASKGRPKKALVPAMRYTPEWIAERNEIYRKLYWDKVGGDTLPHGVDMVVYDFGVNSGPSRALKYLKALGPDTAINTVKRLCAKRLSFVRGLRTFSVFGKGWSRRIASVEAIGVKMALAAQGVTPAKQKERLETEGKEAAKKSASDAAKAGGAAASPGTVTQLPDGLDFSTKVGIAIAVVAVLAVAAVCTYRWWINRERAKAYGEAAKDVK